MFNGNGFMLTLGEYIYPEVAYLKVIIDGKKSSRFAVVNGKERIIVEGLSNSCHTVEILKITESDVPVLFDSLILFGEEVALGCRPADKRNRIEFIGDSITAGYGVLAKNTECAYNTYQQDGTNSYAYLTAQKLGADARYICISGKGIVCNCEGNYSDVKTGEYYNRQTRVGGVCNDGWEPHVVVLNIATNDACGNAKTEEFVPAAKDILQKLRARYKDAEIIWAYGAMTHRFMKEIRAVVRELNKTDKKIHFLPIESIEGKPQEIGAAGHPNVVASIRVAKCLSRKIRSLEFWKNISVCDKL